MTIKQDMHEELVERAELRESEGGGICALPKLKCLVPRGRYDFELYLKAIKVGMYTVFSVLHVMS